jgi:hypothetical protein
MTPHEELRAKAERATATELRHLLHFGHLGSGPIIDALAALSTLVTYGRWQVGPESSSHHPTLPSAVAAAEGALDAALAELARSALSLTPAEGSSSSVALQIAAAPDLLEAARLLEAAEDFNANDCRECEGEGVPELCPQCFPLFDAARVARRAALAKADAIIALLPSQGWRTIDSAPRAAPGGNGPDFLALQGDMMAVGHFVQWSEREAPNFYVSHVGGYEFEQDIESPTHWMPLPSPPPEMSASSPSEEGAGETDGQAEGES